MGFLGQKNRDSKSLSPESAMTDAAKRKEMEDLEAIRARLPPYEPYERPVLPPDVLRDLKIACTIVCREAGPSTEEYNEIMAQADPLEKYRRELSDLRAKTVARQKELERVSHAAQAGARYGMVDQRQPTALPQVSSTQPYSSGYTAENKRFSYGRPAKPATFADSNPIVVNNSSTSLSQQLSPSLIAQQDPPTLYNYRTHTNLGTEANPSQKPLSSAAKALMAAENARKRELRNLTNPAPLAIQRSDSRTSLRSQSEGETSRPRSRASSIRAHIREYIKPRGSLASSRPESRSSTRGTSTGYSSPPSRPESRGSFTAGHGRRLSSSSWFRKIGRKGSSASLRSANRLDDAADNQEVDLNRKLPPLPGLDQYVEPTRLHISQLMTVKTNLNDNVARMPEALSFSRGSSAQSPSFNPQAQRSPQLGAAPYSAGLTPTSISGEPRSRFASTSQYSPRSAARPKPQDTTITGKRPAPVKSTSEGETQYRPQLQSQYAVASPTATARVFDAQMQQPRPATVAVPTQEHVLPRQGERRSRLKSRLSRIFGMGHAGTKKMGRESRFIAAN